MTNSLRKEVYREVENGGMILSEALEKQASKFFKDYYANEEYENYFVEYSGNIVEAFEKINYGAVFAEKSMFAAVAIKKDMLGNLIRDVPQIVNIEKSSPYSLSDLVPSLNDQGRNVDSSNNLGLDGEGVIIGIISTGIDYLNENFMTQDRRTRISAIWDQSLSSDSPPVPFSYGSEFDKEEINKAIRTYFSGGNPYEIVPHKDDVGHGTAIAGIIGASRVRATDEVFGVAPKCEFAIVKVKRAKKITMEEYGIDQGLPNVYESTDLASAISYLAELQNTLMKPMIVYLALGSNFGAHTGRAALERYIDFFSLKRGFSIITDTGDEGNGSTHTSGEVSSTGTMKTIEINVDKEEKNLYLSIWFRNPDVFSVGVAAPSGEGIKRISIPATNGSQVKFTLGSTTITILYSIQAQAMADKMIGILIENVSGGVWKIDLTGEYVIYGGYDVWLLQRPLLKKETRVLVPNEYTTLTIPSTAIGTLTTANYQELTNIRTPEPGKGFTKDGRVKPSVSTLSNNIITVGLEKKIAVVSGTAAAGAILSGLSVLLFEWGFVQRKDLNMFTQKLNSYIIRGTVKEPGVIYPNPTSGFGLLSFKAVFESLSNHGGEEVVAGLSDLLRGEIYQEKIYWNIPTDLFKRLIWSCNQGEL